MKKGLIFSVLVCLVIGTLVLCSCTKTTTTATTTITTSTGQVTTSPATTTTSIQAKWWDKFGEPKYGGTIIVRARALDNFQCDPTKPGGVNGPVHEILFADDWTTNRETEYSFKGAFCPAEFKQGLLAESWEMPDALTINVHLRQGVHWYDKPPVNGREFVAEDVQYNYDRFLGTGSGFTEPNPFLAGMVAFTKRAVAIDKYTVQFQFKTPTALVVFDPMTPQVRLTAPEWIEANPEGSNDWTTVMGTGAFLVTDFVAGSSMMCSKNPDYYGYDERYPQNKIPYIDTYKQVAVPDIATALASLRTGKIDMMTDFSGGATWQQAQSLAETNPEIEQSTLPSEAMAICFRVDRAPFTDINVRKALQMAIDLETIAQSHYGGSTVGVPVGMIPPMYTGWSTPFVDWPADLQADYSYNPERAKQLLADAGFPQGFKTNTVASTSSDLNLLQIVKSYFMDIGVDMEINTMDEFTMMDYCHAGKHDQMAVERAGHMINPWQSIIVRQTGESRNLTFNNDAVFDAMIEDAVSATDIEECKRLLREADLYCLSKFWSVNLCLVNNPIFWQDYVKGYSGERIADYYMSRLWVDK